MELDEAAAALDAFEQKLRASAPQLAAQLAGPLSLRMPQERGEPLAGSGQGVAAR